jgi:hypothetical protein
MVLSHKLITSDYHRVLEDRNTILLIIIHLHIDKKINDAKLKALFKNYRNGTLTRHINTYYSKVNDRWYNDEPMRNIYLDIYEFMPKKDLSLEQVLPYLNLLLNRNKNYCIDFIYKQYVEPIANSIYFIHNNQIDLIESLKLIEIDLTSFDADDLGDGYCCEDCDGSYAQYKSNKYELEVAKVIKNNLIEKAKSFLQSKKTWGSYKNPNNILL